MFIMASTRQTISIWAPSLMKAIDLSASFGHQSSFEVDQLYHWVKL